MKSKLTLPDPLPDAAQRIIHAAREHFLRHGFRSVTMDDLAAQIGMSKKTVYVHFKSKRELLDAVIDQKLGDLAAEMDAIPSGTPASFAETLHAMLECLRRNVGEISPSFVRDVARENPALFGRIKAKRREVVERTFGRILRVGQKAKAIRTDIPAAFLIEILMSMADSMLTPEKLAALGISPKDVLPGVLSVFLQGVLTDKEGPPL